MAAEGACQTPCQLLSGPIKSCQQLVVGRVCVYLGVLRWRGVGQDRSEECHQLGAANVVLRAAALTAGHVASCQLHHAHTNSVHGRHAAWGWVHAAL